MTSSSALGRDADRVDKDLQLLDPESAFSLSEYDLTPTSAPLFVVGDPGRHW